MVLEDLSLSLCIYTYTYIYIYTHSLQLTDQPRVGKYATHAVFGFGVGFGVFAPGFPPSKVIDMSPVRSVW